MVTLVQVPNSTMRSGVGEAHLLFEYPRADGETALTLPAFQWIKVDASHNSARIGHTCHIVGKSQLLSIGGADAAQSDPWSTIDPAFQGLGTFDLNNWNWMKGYNANAAPYTRAGAIEKVYQAK